MSNTDEEKVGVEGRVLAETEKAVLVAVDGGDKQVWFPRSVVSGMYRDERDDTWAEFEVPEWFAIKEGLE